MERPELLLGIVLAFFVFFSLFWCGIVFLIATLGGWRALARRYSANDMEVAGRKWEMQSGSMRILISYRHILTIGASPRGLSLSVLFFFRPGHPPLFIPWEHIEIRERPGLFGRSIRFVFTQVPGTNLTVSSNLGTQVAAAGQRTVLMQ